MELGRQRAVVTGASSGIGRAIAEACARAGAAVVVNYLGSDEKAEEVVSVIAAAGGEAIAVKADISKEDAVARLFERTREAFGGLDILVANAGIQRDAPVGEMSLEDWQKVIDVNLTGQFLCARAAVRQFRAQGVLKGRSRAAGKIVFVSSVHQAIPWAGRVNYAASKGGVKLLMESLAQELAAERIRVNAIAPGAVKTAINEKSWQDPEAAAALRELIPYGRIGEPADIAEAAVWLASDRSDYVVGASLFVDGGMRLYPGFRDNG